MLVITRQRDEALLLTDERTGEQVRVVIVDRAECVGERNKRKRQEAAHG